MAITEQQRFEMHLELRKHLGDDVANTLTEHLPPSGWSDVVRLKDFEALERRFELRIDKVDMRIDGLEQRLDMRVNGLEERLTMRISALEEQANLRFQNLEDRMGSLAGSMRLLIGIAIPSAIAIAGIFIQTLV